MAEQVPDELGFEVRRLERLISANRREGDMLRKTTAILMLGAVGLLVSFSVPWAMHRPGVYTSESSTSGTITRWVDGWLWVGSALSGGAKPAVAIVMVLQVLVMLTLVALCVLLVLSPGPQAAMTATILGWLAAAVPCLVFLASAGGRESVGGSGLVMAAGSSIVVALGANALRAGLLRTPRPVKRTLADLLPPITLADAPRQDDAPTPARRRPDRTD